MLGAMHGMRLCGEAASAEEALQVIPALRPDIVLMDVHMPGTDGPSATRAVLKRFPDMKVIAWTVSEAGDDLLRMMQAGCSGYILKDVGPSELQSALMAVVRSESPVPRKMIPDVLRRVADRTPLTQSQGVPLTSREMQLLRGIAKGFTTKRLAQETKLAVPSIETHLGNIFRKLNASNRGEAVSAALKQGIISLADL